VPRTDEMRRRATIINVKQRDTTMLNQAIKITSLSLRDRPTQANTIDCAFFDVEIAGLIRLAGCLLKRTANGGFVASPPRLASDRAAVDIMDNSVRHAVTAAARNAYIAMGGEHGDYGSETPADHPDEEPRDGAELSAILPAVGREEPG